jgi:hypothetical protein
LRAPKLSHDFRLPRGLASGRFVGHILDMAKKKHGTAWDGIRDAYNVHQAFQLAETLRRSSGRVVSEIGEMIMMVTALAIVCGVFWLLSKY